jgi:hypothetical protein
MWPSLEAREAGKVTISLSSLFDGGELERIGNGTGSASGQCLPGLYVLGTSPGKSGGGANPES